MWRALEKGGERFYTLSDYYASVASAGSKVENQEGQLYDEPRGGGARECGCECMCTSV